jgi:hypothetical protein
VNSSIAAPLPAVDRRADSFPTLAVVLVVLAKTALTAAFLGRYGWQRDELYYAAAARHLSLGYVDFPPVTAVLAAAAHGMFGDSLFGLRFLALASGAGVVVFSTLIARDLGGGRRAQITAAIVAGVTPFVLAENTLFQPVSFDLLLSALLLWLAVRLTLAPSRRLWIAIGVTVGVGLETKYTIGILAAALLVGFAVSRRNVLRLPDVALAAAIALLLFAPNLVWQAQHNWASLRFFLHPGASATDESRPQFVGDLVLLAGLATSPLWVSGFRRLWRDARTRALAVAVGLVVVFYLAAGGKSYYALPAFVLLLAAGAVSFERWNWSRRGIALGAGAVALLSIVLLPVGVPVLPTSTMVKLHLTDARSDYEDEIGWPQLAAQVSAVAASARPSAVIAENYGEAGALELFGRGFTRVVSGHMSYRYWRPGGLASRAVVVVGYDRAQLAMLCSRYAIVRRVAIPYGVDNEEAGAPIATCTLRGDLDAVWPQLVRPKL